MSNHDVIAYRRTEDDDVGKERVIMVSGDSDGDVSCVSVPPERLAVDSEVSGLYKTEELCRDAMRAALPR